MNSVFIASFISAMAMSSELLRDKFENWSDETEDLQVAQQAMISAMMQKIQDLENKMNDQAALNDYISSEIDVLNSK